MRRHREQSGSIFEKSGIWYCRFSDDKVIDGVVKRVRLSHRLGEMTKSRALAEAKTFLATINNRVLPSENAITLTQFVESVFLPRVQQDSRHQTWVTYKSQWKAQLKPHVDGLWIRDIHTRDIQPILDAIARQGIGKNT